MHATRSVAVSFVNAILQPEFLTDATGNVMSLVDATGMVGSSAMKEAKSLLKAKGLPHFDSFHVWWCAQVAVVQRRKRNGTYD